MWRLCWLQLLCHHCISSVQGLDYTKFSLRTPALCQIVISIFCNLSSSASLHLHAFSSTFHPSPCCSTRFTFFCVPYFCFHFLSVLLSSFCSASFLSSLPSVDSEIPVLCKFWPWFMVGQEILVCRQTDSLN